MEQKTSKVTAITPLPDKQWGEKILKKATVTMENGDSGTVTTFPDGTAPAIGQEFSYTYENHPTFGPEIKIKKPGSAGGGGGFRGGGESPKKEASIQKQTALKEAVNFISLQEQKYRTADAVLTVAEKFKVWLAEEPPPKVAPAQPAPAQQIPPAINEAAPPNLQAVPVTPQRPPEIEEDDDLPF